MKEFICYIFSIIIFMGAYGHPYSALLYSYGFWSFALGLFLSMKAGLEICSKSTHKLITASGIIMFVSAPVIWGFFIFSTSCRNGILALIGMSDYSDAFTTAKFSFWKLALAGILNYIVFMILKTFGMEEKKEESNSSSK